MPNNVVPKSVIGMIILMFSLSIAEGLERWYGLSGVGMFYWGMFTSTAVTLSWRCVDRYTGEPAIEQ